MAEATHIAPSLSTQGKSQKSLCVRPWACYLVPSHNLSHFSQSLPRTISPTFLPKKKAFWVKQCKRDNVYKEITAETYFVSKMNKASVISSGFFPKAPATYSKDGVGGCFNQKEEPALTTHHPEVGQTSVNSQNSNCPSSQLCFLHSV